MAGLEAQAVNQVVSALNVTLTSADRQRLQRRAVVPAGRRWPPLSRRARCWPARTSPATRRRPNPPSGRPSPGTRTARWPTPVSRTRAGRCIARPRTPRGPRARTTAIHRASALDSESRAIRKSEAAFYRTTDGATRRRGRSGRSSRSGRTTTKRIASCRRPRRRGPLGRSRGGTPAGHQPASDQLDQLPRPGQQELRQPAVRRGRGVVQEGPGHPTRQRVGDHQPGRGVLEDWVNARRPSLPTWTRPCATTRSSETWGCSTSTWGSTRRPRRPCSRPWHWPRTTTSSTETSATPTCVSGGGRRRSSSTGWPPSGRAIELAVNPANARVLARHAVYDARLGRPEAAQHAAEAVRLSPDDPTVLYKRAVVHCLLGQPQQAVDWLRRAIEKQLSRGRRRGPTPISTRSRNGRKSWRCCVGFDSDTDPSWLEPVHEGEGASCRTYPSPGSSPSASGRSEAQQGPKKAPKKALTRSRSTRSTCARIARKPLSGIR